MNIASLIHRAGGVQMKEPPDIHLGDRVRDKITGFEGIVEAITKWRNQCDRITVLPTRLDKDGKPMEAQSFDVFDLEIVENEGERPNVRQETGGPPARAGDPTR